MSTINTQATSSTGGSSLPQAGTNANFDLFISLLTTQIQNQDPLKPLDSAEYTNQLVQYTMVEQQVATTQKLDEQLTQLKMQSASQFVNYIGKEITAQGATSELKDSKATWNLASASDGEATITIRNDEGAEVHTEEIDLKKGDNEFIWDGVGKNDQKFPDGAYTVEVKAKDRNNQSIVVQPEIKGKVDAVDFSRGTVILKIGDVEVPVGFVKNVSGNV